MTRIRTTFCAAVASLSMSACATNELSPAQRNAAIGGAVGAAAGAAIAKDDLQGAVIGGALGAAIGYYTGCREQGGCFVGGRQVADRDDMQFDRQTGRYYYRDPETGRTYWDNGQLRG